MIYHKHKKIEPATERIFIQLDTDNKIIQILSKIPKVPSWIHLKEDDALSFAKQLSQATGFNVRDNRE
jgi:hypothetical protein